MGADVQMLPATRTRRSALAGGVFSRRWVGEACGLARVAAIGRGGDGPSLTRQFKPYWRMRQEVGPRPRRRARPEQEQGARQTLVTQDEYASGTHGSSAPIFGITSVPNSSSERTPARG